VWSGEKVSPVKRAKFLGNRGALKSRLGFTSVDIEATLVDQLSLEAIIDKVRRATRVDGDDDVSSDPYSVESFMAALKEEASASAAFFGDAGLVVSGGDGAAGAETRTAEELVTSLRKPGSSTTWVAFTVNL